MIQFFQICHNSANQMELKKFIKGEEKHIEKKRNKMQKKVVQLDDW